MDVIESVEIKTHPEDPRVAIVTNRAAFVAAAGMEEFQAVIWKRNESGFVEELRSHFSHVFKMATEEYFLSVRAKSNGFGGMKVEHLDRLNGGAQEIQQLAELYDEIVYGAGAQPREELKVIFALNATSGVHPHKHHVLNFSVDGTGTGWVHNDKTLYVDEGDMFLFKPGFEHFSPKVEAEAQRKTFIVMPARCYA